MSLKNPRFLRLLLGKTHRNNSFCTQSGEEKQVFPLPIIGGEKWAFSTDNRRYCGRLAYYEGYVDRTMQQGDEAEGVIRRKPIILRHELIVLTA
jgi:hypothetical protein